MPTLPDEVARNEFPLMVSVVPRRFVIVAEDEVRVVIPALVLVSVVIVAEVNVALVSERLLIVRLPTLATVNEASAQVRLDGFVPTSMMALLLFMENRRLSAVLTASSAPPAKLVRLAVLGIEPGVSLFFVRITGISRCLRLKYPWR